MGGRLSLLFRVSHCFLTFDGRATAPGVDLPRFVWHLVDLAQPDHTAARGQPSTKLVCASSDSALGLVCGSPAGD
jgi:hypothetical protein